MTNEEKYVEKIISMGYSEEEANDYLKINKKAITTDINPDLGLKEDYEIKLPPVDESVFASSSSKILLTSEINANPYAKGLALLLLIGCIAGLLNGIDFLSPNSGINKPHDLIGALTINAPEKSAIFLGTITLEDGSPAENFSINIRAEKGGNHFTTTDSNGKFRMENLTPGLSLLDIAFIENNTYGVSHRILLNPPAGFEPYGFTQIDIVFPNKNEFGTDNGTGVFWIDYSPEEIEFPLIDPSAATLYTIFGYAFVGLASLGAILSIIALNTGNLGLIRTASGLVFFSMGHFNSACCIGLIVLLLSFLIPKNEGF